MKGEIERRFPENGAGPWTLCQRLSAMFPGLGAWSRITNHAWLRVDLSLCHLPIVDLPLAFWWLWGRIRVAFKWLRGGFGVALPGILHSAFFLLPSPQCDFGWPCRGILRNRRVVARRSVGLQPGGSSRSDTPGRRSGFRRPMAGLFRDRARVFPLPLPSPRRRLGGATSAPQGFQRDFSSRPSRLDYRETPPNWPVASWEDDTAESDRLPLPA